MDTTRTHDFSNNETWNTGVFENEDGTWTAMTFTRSRDFKTKRGAVNWFTKATGKAPGQW